MRIGFIKFGLKTYFNKSGTGQGSNHELVDVFNIFEKRGHECVMLSNTDYTDAFYDIEQIRPYLELDYIFVFNGPLCPGFESKMNMFQGTIKSLNYLKNIKTPWVYFWTDPRKDYDIRNHEIYKINPPKVILSQEKQFYGGLETLVCYKFQQPLIIPERKDRIIVIMNDTDKKRSKKLLNIIEEANIYVDKNLFDIYGNWKTPSPYHTGSLDERDIIRTLMEYKFAINLNKDKKWISQKFYEMALAKTVCFYCDYDEDGLGLDKDSFLRFKNGTDLDEKIREYRQFEFNDSVDKTKFLPEIRKDFLNGDFIYNLIINKIKQ